MLAMMACGGAATGWWPSACGTRDGAKSAIYLVVDYDGCCVMWKGDGDAEMGEMGYGDDAGDNMMDDYRQSADESDIEQDVANEDYAVEESDDFDVSIRFLFFCHL